MTKLSQNENSVISSFLRDETLQTQWQILLDNIPEPYLENLTDNYQSEIFTDFTETVIEKLVNLRPNQNVNDVSNDELASIISKMGSAGLSKLITDNLEQFLQKPSITEPDLKNLADLIACRNEMQNQEKQFLDKAYREYLLHIINDY